MLELLTDPWIDLQRSGARHGEGLFETLRVRAGEPLRLSAHLQRLALGAAFLGLAEPPAPDPLLAFLERETVCRSLADGVLRLVAVDDRLHVWVAPFQPEPPAPIALGLSQRWRRFSQSPLNRFKTLSYLENRLLAEEARQRGLFEVIALNEAGRLTDGARTSLFLVLDGALVTPPAEEGALPGVARRTLLEAGLGREAVLVPADLERAEAILLTNSLRGALPVALYAAQPRPARHPLLEQAAAILG